MDFWGIPLPKAALMVGNLVVLETLVSVDNAAVLASMVMRLPPNQRSKALKYGLIGAYVFRGLCLLLAGWILHIWWIKPIGGAYLLYMAYQHFAKDWNSKINHEGSAILDEDSGVHLESNTIPSSELPKAKFWPWAQQGFWWTVLSIELMDLAFSVDNVLVAVAYADPGPNANAEQKQAALMLLYLGVFIGILAMRFVAQYFVGLMQKYPRLEHSAYLVIGILGIKLALGDAFAWFLSTMMGLESWIRDPQVAHYGDLGFSLLTLGLFAWPILIAQWRQKRR